MHTAVVRCSAVVLEHHLAVARCIPAVCSVAGAEPSLGYVVGEAAATDVPTPFLMGSTASSLGMVLCAHVTIIRDEGCGG